MKRSARPPQMTKGAKRASEIAIESSGNAHY